MDHAIDFTERIPGTYWHAAAILKVELDQIVRSPLEEFRIEIGGGAITRRVDAKVGPLISGHGTLRVPLQWQAAEHPHVVPRHGCRLARQRSRRRSHRAAPRRRLPHATRPRWRGCGRLGRTTSCREVGARLPRRRRTEARGGPRRTRSEGRRRTELIDRSTAIQRKCDRDSRADCDPERGPGRVEPSVSARGFEGGDRSGSVCTTRAARRPDDAVGRDPEAVRELDGKFDGGPARCHEVQFSDREPVVRRRTSRRRPARTRGIVTRTRAAPAR